MVMEENLNEVLGKLRVTSGQRAIVLDAPDSYKPILAALPADVDLAPTLSGKVDFINYFATKRAELERKEPDLKAAMKPGSILWISYPKGSAIPTDLKRDSLRESLAQFGLQAVSQVAIDDIWSALRFKLP